VTVPALSGRILSFQVGRPAPLPWRDGSVASAIVKRPVDGPVAVDADGCAGDEQADLTVHGGPDKAVCCYPAEHGARWAPVLGRTPPPGAFGENLTLSGLTEGAVHIGDTFAVGEALAQVSQPRGPCFKLAARWGVTELPALMARELASGFYLRVLRGGDVQAGDVMTLVDRTSAVSVREVMRVTYVDRHDTDALRAALAVPELALQWRAALLSIQARAERPSPGVDA